MPELPEVETIRNILKTDIVGKKIAGIDIREEKQFIGIISDIIGATIIDVIRRGKVVILKLSNNKFTSIHLKLTGQLLFSKNKNEAVFKNPIPLAYTNKMPGKTTSVIIFFDDNSALFFNDLRKFGWVKVGTEPEGPKSVDVFSTDFTEEKLSQQLIKSKKPIKVLLMDQEAMAGIGNIYANDSLFVAGIHPERKANSLSTAEIHKLYLAVQEIIAEGVRYKGSSAKDEIYILPDGSKGSYQNYFKTYHRENKPCVRCGSMIVRIKQAGRSSFVCLQCQK